MERELPEGWKYCNLGDIGTIISGLNYEANIPSDSMKDGFIPLFRANNIDENIIYDDLIFVPASIVRDHQKIQKNDILIAMSSGSKKIVGKAASFPSDVDATFGAFCAIFRGNSVIVNPQYLRLFFKSKYYRTRISHLSRGANINNLRKDSIKSIELPLPPLETQRQIVAILEKAETIRRLRAESDALAQRLLQSVFLEMFGDPVTNPMGWEKKILGNISDVVSGVTKGRKLEGKNITKTPYLRVANVQDGFLDLSEIKEIEIIPSDLSKYALIKGDILLTEGGDLDKLGRGYIWNEEIPHCIHQNHIFRVRIHDQNLLPEYLTMLIGSNYGKGYFLKAAKKTTGIASINSTQLKKFPVLIPSIERQISFKSIFSKISHNNESLLMSSDKCNTLFNTLMAKAFTGELVA